MTQQFRAGLLDPASCSIDLDGTEVKRNILSDSALTWNLSCSGRETEALPRSDGITGYIEVSRHRRTRSFLQVSRVNGYS